MDDETRQMLEAILAEQQKTSSRLNGIEAEQQKTSSRLDGIEERQAEMSKDIKAVKHRQQSDFNALFDGMWQIHDMLDTTKANKIAQ